jgi:hypothetical protein
MNPHSTPTVRRRRWPLVLGITLLVLFAIVALLPSMIGGFAAGKVAAMFAEEREGKLEIASLDLGWTGRQRLEDARLLAPDGSEVARLSAELPSLLDLATSGGRKLGKFSLRAEASLIADEAGVTNLDRALAVRPGKEKPPAPVGEPGEPMDLGQLLRELDVELEVLVSKAQWSDSLTRAAGVPFVVENFTTRVLLKPGEPVRVNVDGTLSGEQPGRVQVVLALHDLLAGAGLNPAARFEMDAKLDALPSAFVDALAQQPGTLATLLGPQFKVAAAGNGTLESGSMNLRVEGERGAITFQGGLVSGVLGKDEPATLSVSLRPDRAGLERLLATYAPQGLALGVLAEPSIELALTGLRVPVQKIVETQQAGGDVVGVALGGSEFALKASTQGWKADGELLPLAEGASIDGLRLDVALAPQGETRTLTLQFESQLGAGVSGFANAQVRIEDVARFLAGDPAKLIESAQGDEPRFDVTFTLQGLRSRTIAAFAPKELDVVTLLGPELDVRVDVTNGKGRREAIVRAQSPTLTVDMTAWMDAGYAIQPSGEPWTIALQLPQGALARVAAPYVPEGMKLTPGRSVEVRVGPGLRVPIDALASAKDPIAAVIQLASVDASVKVDSLDFADATRAVELRQIELGFHLGHGADAQPLLATVAARLGAKGEGSLSLRAGCAKVGALDALADPLALPELDLSLVGDGLPLEWVDGGKGPEALAQKLGARANVKLSTRVTQDASEKLAAKVELDAKFERASLGAGIDATVEDLFARKSKRAEGVPPALAAKLSARGLKSLEGFLPKDVGASVVELTGDTLSAEVDVQPLAGAKSAQDLRLRAKLDAERVQLSSALELSNGRLKLVGAPLALTVRPTQAMLDRHAGASLPAGTTVALRSDSEQLSVQVQELELQLPGETFDVAKLVSELALRARVELPKLRYAQTGATGTSEFVLESAFVEAALAPRKPASVSAMLALAGAQPAKVELSTEVAELAPFLAPIDAATFVPPNARLKANVEGLRSFSAFLPPEFVETFYELAGDAVRADFALDSVDRKPGEGQLGIMLAMKGVELSGAASLRGGKLEIGKQPIGLTVRLSNALLQRHVAASMPPGSALAFTLAEPVFGLRVGPLSMPLDAWMPAAGSEPATLASVLRRTGMKLVVDAPALRYTHPPATEGQVGATIDVRELVLGVGLLPDKPLGIEALGKIGGEKAGNLALKASVADIGAFVERASDAPLPPVTIEGGLEGLPTALVDALAAQDGLLVDVLGPVVDAKVAGTYPSKTDPLRADLKSANATLKVVARLEEQLVVAVGDEGIDASLPLTPLFSQRIVGGLVPLMVNASKPEGAKPLSLKVSKFQLPLDGDLRKLNGDVSLDLGEVTYEILPGLTRMFDAFGQGDLVRKSANLKSLSIPIKNGIAGYESIPISIKGKEYPFSGTYDIAKGEMKFSAQLPLSLLGKSLTRELDKVKDFIDPDMLVPIEVGGRWNDPSLRLGKGFVDKLLRDALGGDLIDGLQDLFGKKKDKKDGK